MTGLVLDPFAGPGGWSVGLASIGRRDIGIEHNAAACATRAAAGHRTIRGDVAEFPLDHLAGDVDGVIMSPPCQALSKSGDRDGFDLLGELIDAVHRLDWSCRPSANPNVWLVLEVGRWVSTLRPAWLACEQVVQARPLWRAYEHVLNVWGYSTWSGVLNAADYGVAQARERAFLIANRTRPVTAPPATHDDTHDLFGAPARVTMGDHLGWPRDVEFLTARLMGKFMPPDLMWPFDRPALTVAGAPRVGHPGHNDGVTKVQGDGYRVTPAEAGALQSFPIDYPWQGNRTAVHQQIGDAVPPLLAAHVLTAAGAADGHHIAQDRPGSTRATARP